MSEPFAWPNDGNAHYGQPNPSSDPEVCGLEQIAELDEDGLSYEFNTVLAWRAPATGKVYIAQSSGCSCPIPFEEYTSLDDLTEIRTVDDARDFVQAQQSTHSETFPQRDVAIFLEAVGAAFQARTPVPGPRT